MKTSLISLLRPLIILLIAAPAAAQAQATVPAVPGYWNLETNLTTRDYTIVRFYNDQHELLHEERLADLCLDLSPATALSQRTAQQLHGALQQVLRSPATAAQTVRLLTQQLGQSRRAQRAYAVR